MLKKLIAVILTVAMLTGMLPTALAEDNEDKTLYISEVRLGGKSELEKAEYTVFDADLNSGTDKGAVYLGYKTTNDPANAITDIRALEEGKDYQLVDSDKLNAEFFMEDAMADAVALMKIVKEFRKLYEKDELRAKYAYEILQMYAYDENTKLGDYILNDATKATLSLVVLNASDDMKFGLYCALYMGLRDGETDTWQQRMVDTQDEEPDSGLLTDARSMLTSVKSFRVQMNDALAMDYGENEQMDVTLLAAKEVLESYSYGESNLYDYFMDNQVSSETLLPLAAVLTGNEIELIKFIGFANFCYMQDGDVDEKLVKEAHTETEKTEVTDFWMNSVANQAGKVAVTSDALRDMSTNDRESNSKLYEAEIGVGCAAIGMMLITTIMYAGQLLTQNSQALVNFSRFVKTFSIDEYTYLPTLASKLSKVQSIARAGGQYKVMAGWYSETLPASITKFATSTKNASMTTKGLAMNRSTVASKAFSTVGKATIVLTVILCLIDIGFLIYDVATHEDVEHDEKPSRALSLEKLGDGEYGYVTYYTVKYLNGELGDTNNDEAQKWMLLLTTTDTRMGEPIKADTFKIGKNDTMYNRVPVAILGQVKAADLNKNAFKHGNANYLYFERANPDTLASIFAMPGLVYLIAGAALIVAAGITVPIVIHKKRKNAQTDATPISA